MGHSRIILSSLLIMSLAFFWGCRTAAPRLISPPPKLPYKVTGASDADIISMEKRLNQHGVKIVTLGQDYLVSVPAGALFHNETPRLTWGSYALLNDVACFLQQFRKVAVKVVAFSNPCVSLERERALTLARAKAVADYLWSQDINSRFIFAQGLGRDKPILASLHGGDASPNARVEISFRDAVA